MKTYSSVESLAKDLQVSERTVWRYLKKGRVQKEISEDGRRVFVLPDGETEGDDGVASHSDIGRDVTTEEKGRKKYRPTKVSFAQIEPSPAVVSQAERTQIAELQADEEEALLRRKKEHPLVFEMRAKVESKKLNLELQELTKQEDEQRQAEYRRRTIETVKAIVIPRGLQTFLPPDILLVSFRLIDETLKGIDFSIDECIALAQSVVWMKYWGANSSIYRVVRPAIIEWTFAILDQSLREAYAELSVNGFEGTFSDFLSYIFLSMTPDEQAKIVSFAYGKIN